MKREEPIGRYMTTSVIVIDVDRPASEAVECFRQYGFHHLPVVREGRLVGILSSADLLKLEHFLPRGAINAERFIDERFALTQLMRAPVVKLRAAATVGDAADALIATGVHALPVVDDDDSVVGIVSTTDLIRALVTGPPRRGASAGTALSPGEITGEHRIFYHKPTDQELATALAAAERKYVDDHDPRFVAKSLLYLAQRRKYLERVLVAADRYLHAGQDEQNHALLLKAVLGAKRAEEHATGTARAPFPLE